MLISIECTWSSCTRCRRTFMTWAARLVAVHRYVAPTLVRARCECHDQTRQETTHPGSTVTSLAKSYVHMHVSQLEPQDAGGLLLKHVHAPTQRNTTQYNAMHTCESLLLMATVFSFSRRCYLSLLVLGVQHLHVVNLEVVAASQHRVAVKRVRHSTLVPIRHVVVCDALQAAAEVRRLIRAVARIGHRVCEAEVPVGKSVALVERLADHQLGLAHVSRVKRVSARHPHTVAVGGDGNLGAALIKMTFE
mmetsp:Transcript_40000/g.100094  ORF Transcript_40000/g.100094 Transcript_40000/m.100094 type:complete len:249 (-) Transcript_40000:670-1416(-)